MTYFRIYRSAVLMRTEKNQIQVVSNSKICSKHVIPPPSAYLSRIRLQYLFRVCSYAPLELKTLIWADFRACPKFSWLGFCFSDLVWLKDMIPCLDHLPDPFEDYMPWYSLIVDLTNEFFKYVDNACDSSCFSVPDIALPIKICTVVCDLCGVKLFNPQELSAHKWQVHKAKSCFRRKIATTDCIFCLVDFHTRTKVHDHIAYRSTKCRNFYLEHMPDLDVEVYECLESDETIRVRALVVAGKRKNYHPVPCYRLSGPRPVGAPVPS